MDYVFVSNFFGFFQCLYLFKVFANIGIYSGLYSFLPLFLSGIDGGSESIWNGTGFREKKLYFSIYAISVETQDDKAFWLVCVSFIT